MSKDSVRAYYAHFGEREWLRLTNPDDGAIEFALTTHMLKTYLPPAGRILDIGGGPGRYAIWLAQRGYRVVLADLSPELLRLATANIAAAQVEAHIEAVVEADACDLHAWATESFDAVLCLGPFYYLPDATERQRAAAELTRSCAHRGLPLSPLCRATRSSVARWRCPTSASISCARPGWRSSSTRAGSRTIFLYGSSNVVGGKGRTIPRHSNTSRLTKHSHHQIQLAQQLIDCAREPSDGLVVQRGYLAMDLS